ncbi:MAG: hypothetical protein ACNYNY_02180, partial [Candidatus Oxydemutatoraceae bacterium WSBS_2016_MAG_OTU14]
MLKTIQKDVETMAIKDKRAKLWHGRFQTGTETDFEQFSSSIHFDYKLYRQEIAVSKVHAQALQQVNLISAKEGKQIALGLKQIGKEIE